MNVLQSACVMAMQSVRTLMEVTLVSAVVAGLVMDIIVQVRDYIVHLSAL